MAYKALPSQEFLRKLFLYDPMNGSLYWKVRDASTFNNSKRFDKHRACKVFNSQFSGRQAFTSVNGRGYCHGSINSQNFLAHRIIWKFVHGFDPDQIDHINGDKTDNQISNLRSVTQTENNRNLPKTSANKSGTTGVCFCNRSGKWLAYIVIKRKFKNLGLFKDKQEAISVRKNAEKEFGFHENHGRAA